VSEARTDLFGGKNVEDWLEAAPKDKAPIPEPEY
tara:strand:+ start:273 stop:374 length:102 start_codon:yes stop_codon:yes gene_type:complete